MDKLQLIEMLVVVLMTVLLSKTVFGQDNSTEASPTEAPCPCENGVCTRKNDSSLSCICDRHWTGDNCDQEIGRCLEDNPCNDVNAQCLNMTDTAMGFQCSCKMGFYKDEGDGKCKEHLLWTGYRTENQSTKFDGASNSDNRFVVQSESRYPIPFFSYSTSYVTQTEEGYIILGDIPENFHDINRFVKSKWTAYPFYIGPYWSDFRYEDGANAYFSEETVLNTTRSSSDMASTLLLYAKTVIQANDDTDSKFNPLLAYSITWENVLPRKCIDPYCNDRATVQLVLATDLRFTYVIVTWHNVFSRSHLADGPEVVAGHSHPDGGFVSLDSAVKPKTRAVLRLFSTGQPTAEPMTCVNHIETMREAKNFSSLTQCPCQEKDIKMDFRFTHVPSSNTGARQAYQERYFSASGEKQECHYDSLGLYLSGPSMQALPITQSPTFPTLTEVKQSCCERGNPALCDMFYQQLPQCRPTPTLKTASGGGNSALYMTTFSGDKFTFNGWGEYILVKSGMLELQARTQRNGDTNTTSFSAFAVKVAHYASYQIYITPEGSLTSGWTQGEVLQSFLFLVDTSEENTVTITAFGGRLKVDLLPDSNQTNGVSDSLAFTITLPLEAATQGLCGDSHSTETSASDDAEQWRVENQTVSLFDYTKPTATSFDQINVHEGFSPEVLPMEASQVFALFADEAKRNQARELCGEHIFCLQEFYLSHNLGGTASNILARDREMTDLVNEIEQVPPIFQELTQSQTKYSPSQLQNGVTLDIAVTAPSSDGVTFTLQGSFSEMENVSMDGNSLQMTDLNMTILRGLKYPQSLGIVATDPTTNLSSIYWPRMHLCLCEEDDQCLGDGYQTEDRDGTFGHEGNVMQVTCQCSKLPNPVSRSTGRYCEQPLDVCSDCFNDTACDTNKTSDFCAACPEHMEGDGYLCRDIDECSTDNGGCQQTCTNTHMGSQCSCHPGYITNGTRCFDINECVEDLNICNSSTKYCFNTPGDYECRCYGDGIGQDCVRAPYVYSLDVQLAPIAGQRWSDISGEANVQAKAELETKLRTAITIKITTGGSAVGSADDLIVEIGGFSNLQQRSRRAVDRGAEVGALVVVRSSNPVSDSDMTAALSLGDCQSNCDMEGVLVYREPELQPGSELCSVGVVNQCDVLTSKCVTVDDSRVMCQCLSGFQTAQNPNMCQDINECVTQGHQCHGQDNCTNTFGSYSCSCDSHYYWDHSDDSCKADACQSNPCQSDYDCYLQDGPTNYFCSPKSSGSDDADDWRTALIVVACVLCAFCLILLILVIFLAIRRKKALEMDAYSNSRYNDLAGNPRQQGYNKRGSATEMAEQRSRRNVYEAPGRNGDYTSAYDNRSFSNDRL